RRGQCGLILGDNVLSADLIDGAVGWLDGADNTVPRSVLGEDFRALFPRKIFGRMRAFARRDFVFGKTLCEERVGSNGKIGCCCRFDDTGLYATAWVHRDAVSKSEQTALFNDP